MPAVGALVRCKRTGAAGAALALAPATSPSGPVPADARVGIAAVAASSMSHRCYPFAASLDSSAAISRSRPWAACW
jgi:hypothetical protein